MEPGILDAPGDGETPPLRWRPFYYTTPLVEQAFGITVWSRPEPHVRWALHVYLGKWLIGVECTWEEDD